MSTTLSDRPQAVLLVVLLVTAGSLGQFAITSTAVGATPAVDAEETAPPPANLDRGSGDRGSFVQENNSSVVRHENPDREGQRGDLGMLEGWLAGRMGEVLVDCTEGARAREWGACDTDEEYPEWLSKYVDVSRETDTSRDDKASDAFEDARENQNRFNDRAREFWETYRDYEEARENGNTARARELARELQRLDRGVNRSAGRLVGDYRVITQNTRANLSESTTTVREIEQNVSRTTDEVNTAVFVETELTVEAEDGRISFVDPLELTGRLTTVNGTALSNRQVLLSVGNQTLLTSTGGDGSFEQEYRPTTLALNTSTIQVRYLPRNDSIYLPSEDSVGVTVSQVDPEVTVSRSPAQVAFGETLTVSGMVSVESVGARGVPVVVSVGNERLATTRTNSTGEYQTAVRIPADVANGTQPVRAWVPLEGRALAGTSVSTPVSVASTATTLSVETTQTGPDTVRTTGRLTTIDGTGVESQAVRINVEGETVATTTTGTRGRFAETVDVPASAPANSTITLRVQFEGQGTNLEPARNQTALALTAMDGGEATAVGEDGASRSVVGRVLGGFSENIALLAGLVVAVLAVAGGAYWLQVYRDGQDESATVTDGPAPSVIEDDLATGPSVPLSGVEETTDPRSLLEIARAEVASGNVDLGIVAAYAAMRRDLAAQLDITGTQTHWEFLESVRNREAGDDVVGALEQLTAAYEQAEFSPVSVSHDLARSIIPDDSTGARSGNPGDD